MRQPMSKTPSPEAVQAVMDRALEDGVEIPDGVFLEPQPKRETLSELYCRRLLAHKLPISSWGADQENIFVAWRRMEERPGTGLIVGGKFGRGKTALVHAMLDYPRSNGVLCVHTSSPAEVAWLDTDECKEEHLFIDDIGTDGAKRDYGTVRDYVGEYLRWWMDKKLWRGWTKRLFLTTNLSLAELNERYGTRLVSRIMECCVPLKLTGPNRRTIQGGAAAWKGF